MSTTDTTNDAPSLEFEITVSGVTYGLDLAKLTVGEIVEIEQRAGQRYGEVLAAAIGDGLGFEMSTAAVIAAIARRRVADDDVSLDELIAEHYELQMGELTFKIADRKEEDAGPTQPESGHESGSGISGSQN